MSRRVQFSVSRRDLVNDHLEGTGSERAFLESIAAEGAGVELFDPRARVRDVAYAQDLLAEHDLSIDTVHGSHLQPLLDPSRGPSDLLSRLRAEHLASVIDVTPDRTATPAVSTHHLPRLWPEGDLDAATARRRMLQAFINALDAVEPDPT